MTGDKKQRPSLRYLTTRLFVPVFLRRVSSHWCNDTLLGCAQILTLHKNPTMMDVCPVAGWQPSFTALYQELKLVCWLTPQLALTAKPDAAFLPVLYSHPSYTYMRWAHLMGCKLLTSHISFCIKFHTKRNLTRSGGLHVVHPLGEMASPC